MHDNELTIALRPLRSFKSKHKNFLFPHVYFTTTSIQNRIFLADVIALTNYPSKNCAKSDRSNSILRIVSTGQFRRHSSQSPALLKIGETTALPVMLCSLFENQWDRTQSQSQSQHQSDDDETIAKGNDEFVVDDYDQLHDAHHHTEIEIETETEHQPHLHHLTYSSKLNDRLREKLTPLFNRKHYASLPQNPPPSSIIDSDKSRKNSYNYSA